MIVHQYCEIIGLYFIVLNLETNQFKVEFDMNEMRTGMLAKLYDYIFPCLYKKNSI